MSVPLLRWEVPGPYEVVFTTRGGGVSEGPFESLNLGRRTGDEVERVDENRRRLCAEVGADEQDLTLGFQTHSTVVNRAEAGSRGAPGDGLWTDEPGDPDARPRRRLRADRHGPHERRRARARGPPRRLAGLARRDRRLGRDRSLGPGFAAVVGPTIGPCCYEVGDEVASRFRARFGDGIVSDRKLDLWTAAEQAALDAGASTVDRLDLCTRCRADLFFSRAPHGPAARHAGRPWPCPLSRSRRGSPRVRDEVGPDVTIVAATKYVSVDDMATLAEAGIDIVGENRAQDLEAKHAAHGDAFRWHFIGHLQSRKAKVVNRICELVHSLDSESAARRLEIPALVQVNLAGEAIEVGRVARSAPGAARRSTRTCAVSRRCRRPRRAPKTRARTSANCENWPKNTA